MTNSTRRHREPLISRTADFASESTFVTCGQAPHDIKKGQHSAILDHLGNYKPNKAALWAPGCLESFGRLTSLFGDSEVFGQRGVNLQQQPHARYASTQQHSSLALSPPPVTRGLAGVRRARVWMTTTTHD